MWIRSYSGKRLINASSFLIEGRKGSYVLRAENNNGSFVVATGLTLDEAVRVLDTIQAVVCKDSGLIDLRSLS